VKVGKSESPKVGKSERQKDRKTERQKDRKTESGNGVWVCLKIKKHE